MSLDGKLVRNAQSEEGRVRAWHYVTEQRNFHLLVELRKTRKLEIWPSNTVEVIE